jgi:serine/threonine-protein kinase
VLDGSIQRSADRIRVSARLINVANGAVLWASTFDERFTDVFSIQDAISDRVANALKLSLSGDSRGFSKRSTENPRAYELYLQGRYHWNRLIPTEVRKSIEFYEQAIEIDPNYSLAYTGLAAAHISLPISSDVPPANSLPQAKAAALKALSIDDSLADAHAYLAFVKFWYDWDWTGAESELNHALALNPNSAEAHRAYGILLSQLGRFDEAIVCGERARQLDPLALITRTNEAIFLYCAGHLAEAEERLIATLELEPNFWIASLVLGKVYLQLEKYDQAIDALLKAKRFSGGSTQPLAMLGFVYGTMNDQALARTVLEELEVLAVERYVPPYNFALVFYGLQLYEQAFAWLERAYNTRDVLLTAFINVEPFWQGLKNEKRFVDLLKRMGLA